MGSTVKSANDTGVGAGSGAFSAISTRPDTRTGHVPPAGRQSCRSCPHIRCDTESSRKGYYFEWNPLFPDGLHIIIAPFIRIEIFSSHETGKFIPISAFNCFTKLKGDSKE